MLGVTLLLLTLTFLQDGGVIHAIAVITAGDSR